MTADRWSDDAFLDSLRHQGDPRADETVARLRSEGEIGEVNRIFRILGSDRQPLPADAPAPFREFMEATSERGEYDRERFTCGGEVFTRHAYGACLVLLAASLPSGYAAPCLSRVLTVSDDLANHPYRRLMGVLQLVVEMAAAEPQDPGGHGHLLARKLRLLHAGIRAIVPRYRPGYEERYGVPVNHEDMLATIMGFSYLVIEGLGRLGLGLTDAEAEDAYYPWRVFARWMGIHPPGQPESDAYVPGSVAEAAEFYASYTRRNWALAADNPDGVRLSRINLEMMQDLLPRPLRLLGLGRAPRLAMQELLGEEMMVRVGVQPVMGHRTELAFCHALLRLAGATADRFADRLSLVLFQHMIDESRGGVVRYCVPPNLAAVRSRL